MKDTTTVYQHGTLAMLVVGLFEGTLPVSELMKHGDTGIGTANDFDGELVIVDGTVYQVVESGEVKVLAPDDKIPFASVHFHQSRPAVTINNTNGVELEHQLENNYQFGNSFVGINIQGAFKRMHTRVVPKQSKPYPKLSAAIKVQPKFSQENVTGTIVGYYAPFLFQGATVGGFHLHFINDAHDFGGHILDFEIDQAEVEVQPLENLLQHLPINDKNFQAANLNLQNMNEEIESAEH
ncbi:acetolactate decarboxylase [Paucilactobacillus nenjiangensis]|jgi:acetolactate decarboxylase|uniref:Alpha-acetolactate decarboxylase n=1 Tax=Paucilactobacillus nenjiangensis TaxID=1296540 RepID=A0A5P1X013_9LACO|nr:acetolactate decarboxylase [Paucilactobacillus nenjiangensis]QER67222.1 acetolactate decarboxylase [Paucilactobacillus nenjiangensis]